MNDDLNIILKRLARVEGQVSELGCFAFVTFAIVVGIFIHLLLR